MILFAVSTQSYAYDAKQAYTKSIEKMNVEMQKGMDSDATTAWVKLMVAHHQGAIEMAQAVLKETKDPLIREMAEKAIKEQTREQTMLKFWITKNAR